MKRLLNLPAILSLLAFTHAIPAPTPSPKPLPLLVWHGLGDRYDADGLRSTGDLAQEVHPGTYVYYIHTDDDGGNDRTNTFFGNLTTQITEVCEAIRDDPALRRDDSSLRVDALGFSQGGQFLRGLLQRCDDLSVRSLITFGSQHNGISDFQKCGDFDFVCKGASALMKGNAWTQYVQNKVVPAQYYRTINQTTGLGTDGYLEYSNFLADVNNERRERNETYVARIAGLEKFVMFVFAEDTTVIPKETGWFAEVNATSGEVTPLRERKIYKEDWLGLKKLDEKGGLVFRNISGAHMALDDKVLRHTFGKYFGPERSAEKVDLEDIVANLPAPMRYEEVMSKDSEWRAEYQQQLALLEKMNRERLKAEGVPDLRIDAEFDVVECAADKAQARWDSMSWWQKGLWRWKAVYLPWLRGEMVPLSEVEDRLRENY